MNQYHVVDSEALECFFFFFSSRRRHTRYWRDWSSDVCSSDLEVLEELLSAEDLARVARELEEDLELHLRDVHAAAVQRDRALRAVDRQRAGLDHLTHAAAGPAQERAHAASELERRERLRDVVVGAELEAVHLVRLLGLGGQHDDRDRALLPQLTAYVEA